MKTKYLLDILKVRGIDAQVYGWPLALTLAAGLILLLSVHTNWLDWLWEFVVAGL